MPISMPAGIEIVGITNSGTIFFPNKLWCLTKVLHM